MKKLSNKDLNKMIIKAKKLAKTKTTEELFEILGKATLMKVKKRITK